MRIASGVTDQYIYFVAVDATDFTTRETGLSSFTVYRSRNGGAAAAYTTPTINETDQTNMPGVYELLLDEDMTIDSGDETQEICLHITHAGMAPVTRVIELYRPKITAGNTLDVTSGGAAGVDWGNVENATTSVALTGTTIATTQKVDVETIKTNAVVNGGTVTFPTNATLASTTNITGGTITTVTNLTNAPTSGDLTATMKTSVETAVSNQIVAYALDHLLFTSVAGTDVADNSALAKLVSKSATADWDSYTNTTDALEALRDRGDAAWITATSVTVSDKTGFKLASDGLDLVTAWTVDITGDVTGNLSGSVGSVTGNVGGNVTGSVGSVTGAVGSVTGAVGSVTGNVGGNVTGSIGSLAAQAKADVNAEVVDVFTTDVHGEPGQEAPGVSVSYGKKIDYLYKAWRNKKTQTATETKLFADDTTTVDQKATVSDDGVTFTSGEMGTGA